MLCVRVTLRRNSRTTSVAKVGSDGRLTVGCIIDSKIVGTKPVEWDMATVEAWQRYWKNYIGCRCRDTSKTTYSSLFFAPFTSRHRRTDSRYYDLPICISFAILHHCPHMSCIMSATSYFKCSTHSNIFQTSRGILNITQYLVDILNNNCVWGHQLWRTKWQICNFGCNKYICSLFEKNKFTCRMLTIN